MSVLVLNQDYHPLMICSVRRAFLLIYLNKAELITRDATKELRTISTSYPYPSVIKIDNYVNKPYKGVVLTRQNTFKRDSFECQYCGEDKNLTLDHLIPRSKGGKSTWTNLVTACTTCNAKKSDFNLEETQLTLRKTPVKPSYLVFLKKSGDKINEDWLDYLQPKSINK